MTSTYEVRVSKYILIGNIICRLIDYGNIRQFSAWTLFRNFNSLIKIWLKKSIGRGSWIKKTSLKRNTRYSRNSHLCASASVLFPTLFFSPFSSSDGSQLPSQPPSLSHSHRLRTALCWKKRRMHHLLWPGRGHGDLHLWTHVPVQWLWA